MDALRSSKRLAITLRRKGESLSDISKRLSIAKSTASLWVRSVTLSAEAQSILDAKRSAGRLKAAQTNRSRTARKLESATTYGAQVLSGMTLSKNQQRLLCALLYWCEGEKLRVGGKFSFTNSDPHLVATFLRLLRNGFTIDERKLRLTIHLHEYHVAKTQLQFWSKVTTIPISQCNRPYRKPHSGVRTRSGYQGCVAVTYFDIDLGRKVEAIAKEFLRKNGSIV